jgi:hypothetical protein
MTGKLVELTLLRSADKLAYLDPLLTAGRTAPITVATLNYDNGVELRAASLGIKCETGLGEWSSTGAFPSPALGIDLMKLHGSVRWWWDTTDEESPVGLRYRALAEVSDYFLEDVSKQAVFVGGLGRRLGVIFGGPNKLTPAGPFLDLLAKFKRVLDGYSHLLVIGYSFRDPHVNQCIARWLGRDASRRVTIVERQGASATDNLFCQTWAPDLGGRLKFEAIGAESGFAKYFGNRA